MTEDCHATRFPITCSLSKFVSPPAVCSPTKQPTALPAASPGRYVIKYGSTVQRPYTQRNCFQGLVRLGGDTFVEINSSGRDHIGTATIQLRNPKTQQPCSAESWRAALPPCAPAPSERAVLLEVENSTPGVAGPASSKDAEKSNAELGVTLSLSMYGRQAWGCVKLFRGPEPSGYLMESAHVFDVI